MWKCLSGRNFICREKSINIQDETLERQKEQYTLRSIVLWKQVIVDILECERSIMVKILG